MTVPENLRLICEGKRPDLTAEQLAAYRPLCAKLMGKSSESAAPSNLPPMLIRGWNFAAAMARWALAGLPRRSKAEISERLAICQTCDYLQNNVCTHCGCQCVEQNQLMNKLAIATERCPEGKWE